MDRIRVRGGHRLQGVVEVSGSKNACLPILAASVLMDGPMALHKVPHLADVTNMLGILRQLGVRHRRRADGAIELEVVAEDNKFAPYDLVRTMRASFVLLGPLWARRGYAKVSYPGGCVFGHRPVDLHVKGLRGIGARIHLDEGFVIAEGPVRGGDVFLGSAFGSTVLGTANVVLAAVLGENRTTIEAAAMEPEVEDLCNFLNASGAKIQGIGSHRLVIDGVERLHGCEWSLIPDRIEAGTFLAAGLLTNSQVEVRNVRPDHLGAVVDRFREAGGHLEVSEDRIRTLPNGGRLRACELTTLPYPGFPTDLQAQFMSLMAVADGVSVITEKVYPERFIHAAELSRLGANIRREGPSAIIQGAERLSGAPVMASDLRASAALLLAGLIAEGRTEVNRVYHIDRGYERIEEKLRQVGADVERVSDAQEE